VEKLRIDGVVAIPWEELEFSFSRSGGPGGQNVNKVETRVTLLFDLSVSTALSPEQKDRIRRALASRISRNGVLRVVAQTHRTQAANRAAAVERFAGLLRQALARPRRRVPTRVSAVQKRKRLDAKRRRSALKRTRSGPIDEF